MQYVIAYIYIYYIYNIYIYIYFFLKSEEILPPQVCKIFEQSRFEYSTLFFLGQSKNCRLPSCFSGLISISFC